MTKQIFKEFLTFCADTDIKPELASVFYDKENQVMVATDAYALATMMPNTEIKENMLINFHTGYNNSEFFYPNYTQIIPKEDALFWDTDYKGFLEIMDSSIILKIKNQDVYVIKIDEKEFKFSKKQFDKIIKLFKAQTKFNKNFTINIYNTDTKTKPVYFKTDFMVNALIIPVNE